MNNFFYVIVRNSDGKYMKKRPQNTYRLRQHPSPDAEESDKYFTDNIGSARVYPSARIAAMAIPTWNIYNANGRAEVDRNNRLVTTGWLKTGQVSIIKMFASNA